MHNKPLWLSIIFIALVVSACSEPSGVDQEFIDDYNLKVQRVNSLIDEHNDLIDRINTNLNDEALYLQSLQEYEDWTDQNSQELIDFKLFVETYHNELTQAGVNPDYVRDNVKSILEVIQKNQ